MISLVPFPPPSQSLGTNTHLQRNTEELFATILFLSNETFIENWEEQLQ